MALGTLYLFAGFVLGPKESRGWRLAFATGALVITTLTISFINFEFKQDPVAEDEMLSTSSESDEFAVFKVGKYRDNIIMTKREGDWEVVGYKDDEFDAFWHKVKSDENAANDMVELLSSTVGIDRGKMYRRSVWGGAGFNKIQVIDADCNSCRSWDKVYQTGLNVSRMFKFKRTNDDAAQALANILNKYNQ